MLKYFYTAVILLLIIWLSFFPSPVQQGYFPITRNIIILAFLALIIKKRNAIFSRSDLPLWLFLIAVGLNVFYAQKKDVAIYAYGNLFWPLFCIYYLVSKSDLPKMRFALLAKIICYASFFVSFLGLLESVFAINPIYEYFVKNPYYQRYITGFVRPMSTQLNPAPLGTYLLACLPFNLFLIKNEKSPLRRIAIVNIVFSVVVIILTFSRGVFLALVVMVIIYLLLEKRYLLAVTFVTIVALFITFCFYMPYPFSKLGIDLVPAWGKSILSEYRIKRLAMIKNIILDHPFVGLGLEHLRIRFDEYYLGKNAMVFEYRIMDNMYLTILGETGVLGFSSFCVFILSLLVRGFKKLKALECFDIKRNQLLIVWLSFITLLVNMAGYDLFYWNNQYFLFCIISGCLAGMLA